jgi:hypothetical protein
MYFKKISSATDVKKIYFKSIILQRMILTRCDVAMCYILLKNCPNHDWLKILEIFTSFLDVMDFGMTVRIVLTSCKINFGQLWGQEFFKLFLQVNSFLEIDKNYCFGQSFSLEKKKTRF